MRPARRSRARRACPHRHRRGGRGRGRSARRGFPRPAWSAVEAAAVREDGRAEDLGTDDELVLQEQQTGADAADDGAADAAVAEVLFATADHDTELRGIHEAGVPAREEQARENAGPAVAGVRGERTRGDEELGACGQRRRVRVLAEEANVAADADVTDRNAVVGPAMRDAVDDRVPAVRVELERDVEADAHAIADEDRAAEMHDVLVLDDGGAGAAVSPVLHQRPERVVVDEAEREAPVAAQVEGVEGEPLAPALRRRVVVLRIPQLLLGARAGH